MTIDNEKDNEPSPFKLIFTLGVAGLLSGLAIIGIYEATFETIKEYKAKTLQKAIFKVLPGTTRIEKLGYVDGQMRVSEQEDGEIIYAGYDNKNALIGYAIPGEGPGFQDTIRLLYGYKPDKRLVVGMEILESRETPGLGDKIYKDANFTGDFKALAIDPEIVLVKKLKKDPNSPPNEVDAISGATISSKAVVRIINKSNKKWLERLP